MSDILFLILRQLRAPLITLIVAYGIATMGLTLMPGTTPEGRPWNMGYFHAFYVISYTATTIGFGEIPYPFSDAQRAWLTFSIYLTVIAWTYTLGAVFTLFSNATFRAAIARSLFAWRVKMLHEPFYVICGYGQSSKALSKALDRMGVRVVVIEQRPERAAAIAIELYNHAPIVLNADARHPQRLREAGIDKALCYGLVAMTGDDNANQAIAIGARTLRADLRVIARVKTEIAKVNITEFGGVEVVNPFDTFATNVGIDIDHPDVLRLEEWLTASPGTLCPRRVNVPDGAWVIVGLGRFGRAIARELDRRKIAWQAVDNHAFGGGDARLHVGDDMMRLLEESHIATAAVVVAGTDNDATNLAVITLARRKNPDIWTVIRQNNAADSVLIAAAKANLRFVQSEIVVHECLQLLKDPLLGEFLRKVRTSHPEDAGRTIDLVRDRLGSGAPLSWSFYCDPLKPGLFQALLKCLGRGFSIRTLLRGIDNPDQKLPAAALMHVRGGTQTLLPDPETPLMLGDRVLFVGRSSVRAVHARLADDPSAMETVITGSEAPRTWFFRWLRDRAVRKQLAKQQSE
jgi:Trk K+ transport system NAD-binding subunit